MIVGIVYVFAYKTFKLNELANYLYCNKQKDVLYFYFGEFQQFIENSRNNGTYLWLALMDTSVWSLPCEFKSNGILLSLFFIVVVVECKCERVCVVVICGSCEEFWRICKQQMCYCCCCRCSCSCCSCCYSEQLLIEAA